MGHLDTPRKRTRDDTPPLSPDSTPKRACPDPPSSSHLSFLEELCEFESSADSNALESAMQEELVTEMMKSLEKVIGDIEESSWSDLPSVSGQDLRLGESLEAQERDLESVVASQSSGQSLGFSESEFRGTEVDIRHLLEASDDELGIPTSSRSQAETSDFADWSLLDQRSPDLTASAHVLQSPAGLYSHVLGGWLDEHFEESMPDFSRDHCDLITLDL